MENVEKQAADKKPCVPTSKRTRISSIQNCFGAMQNCFGATQSTSHGGNSDEQKHSFTLPSCNDEQSQINFAWLPSDCNEQNTFSGLSSSSSNEILLKLDHCDEDEIPGLFKYIEKYLPGYRFVPTDAQLCTHYLRKKIANEHIPTCLIRDVNLYHYHPKDLAERYPRHDSLVDEWYFFTPRDRKYPNGSRPKRAAGNGYWKATGADKPVKVKDEPVGCRQALVFYEGKPPKGEKTNWIMHEFKAVEKRHRNSKGDMRLDDWVLCRIYYKKVDKPLKKEEDDADQVEEEYPVGYDYDDNLVKNPGCMFPLDNNLSSPGYLLDSLLTNVDFDDCMNFDQDFDIPADKFV